MASFSCGEVPAESGVAMVVLHQVAGRIVRRHDEPLSRRVQERLIVEIVRQFQRKNVGELAHSSASIELRMACELGFVQSAGVVPTSSSNLGKTTCLSGSEQFGSSIPRRTTVAVSFPRALQNRTRIRIE